MIDCFPSYSLIGFLWPRVLSSSVQGPESRTVVTSAAALFMVWADKLKPVCVQTQRSSWVKMLVCVKCFPKLMSKLKITVPRYPNDEIFIFAFSRYRRVKAIFEKA